MSKRTNVSGFSEAVDETFDAVEDTSPTEGAKMFDLKNISGTPLFPIFDGEQVTMFPNDIIPKAMSTYDECMAYIATFNDGIIVTRIY